MALKLNKINDMEKIKTWLMNLWEKTVTPFLKKNWMQLVNILVLFVAYDTLSKNELVWSEGIVGLWIFVLLAYYIFWKLLRVVK